MALLLYGTLFPDTHPAFGYEDPQGFQGLSWKSSPMDLLQSYPNAVLTWSGNGLSVYRTLMPVWRYRARVEWRYLDRQLGALAINFPASANADVIQQLVFQRYNLPELVVRGTTEIASTKSWPFGVTHWWSRSTRIIFWKQDPEERGPALLLKYTPITNRMAERRPQELSPGEKEKEKRDDW